MNRPDKIVIFYTDTLRQAKVKDGQFIFFKRMCWWGGIPRKDRVSAPSSIGFKVKHVLFCTEM